METVRPDLVIVYDKYTESAANGLSGKLAGTYTCNVQETSVFKSSKNKYSNNNNVLFLTESKELISTYLSMGERTEYVIEEEKKAKVYAYLYSLGKWRGIWVDMENSIKALTKYEKLFYYLFHYYGDFFSYPFNRRRLSKELVVSAFYETAVRFFLKEENIRMIIPD